MGARYDLPPGARIRVLTASGKVHVIAEDRPDIDIDPPDRQAEPKEGGHIFEVRAKSTNLQVRCPTGAAVSVGTVSGAIRLTGEFASLKISTVSGDVEVDRVRGQADIRAISGDIEVG